MASSNTHWPSMFKSKPCSNNSHHHHPWQQHDVSSSSLLAAACGHSKPTYTSSVGEERSPEPKPRWNPRPEQIRILEAIFNSGMVNPPRDEIRRIRIQLQEYGQVGDANVFYWFQNRKSRTKHKHRHLHSSTRSHSRSTTATQTSIMGPTSSSTSSSGSAGSKVMLTGVVEAASPAPASPTLSVNQNPYYIPSQLTEVLVEPHYLRGTAQESGFSAVTGHPQQFAISVGPAMYNELVWGTEGNEPNGIGVDKLQNPNPNVAAGPVFVPVSHGGATAAPAGASVGSSGPINEIQGVVLTAAAGTAARSTVIINEVTFEVTAGPLNVREAFGDEAILIHSSGHPVLTDHWGLTLHPLQHGASYYLV